MAKKVVAVVKLQLPAGRATPAPPVGPALAQYGINIKAFCDEYNKRTAGQAGTIVPAEITVYQDRSFSFVTKAPPASVLLKEAARVEKGSGEPNRQKVGRISREKLRELAERKMAELNTQDVEAAERILAGTARSMGIEIGD